MPFCLEPCSPLTGSSVPLELHQNIGKAFNREFVGPDGITKETKNVPPYHEWIAGGSGESGKFRANTQTSYVVPLQA